MSTTPARVAASLSIAAIAITGFVRAQVDPPTEGPEERNRLVPLQDLQIQTDSNVLQTFGPGSTTFREQSERFHDPQQRAAVRAEQRAEILGSHQGISRLLQIDAATESKLIELLTDLRMSSLEQFHTAAAARSSQGAAWEPLYVQAERETAKVQALRELLGQEKLERYQAHETRVHEYTQAAKLDARLDAAHKLSFDQKQRLVELWREQTRMDGERERSSLRSRKPFGALFEVGQQLPSPEQLERQSKLMTIASNEGIWRRMAKADAWLRQRAAEFLTPPQLDALARMNAERADSLRNWIENARVQAGLSPQIPDEPEADPPSPALLPGDVKVVVKLTINRGEANHFTHTGRNGASATFHTAEGLFVEVRPTIYEDESFDVRVFYYEPDGRGRRRLIGEGGQMGQVDRGKESSGTGGTVITGNQGYAVLLSTYAEPV